jgi:hypothetical protein
MTVKLNHAPLRVDFGGGWLDVPAFAVKGAYITNCAISPVVTLDSWPYERCGGLGGSAAYALLKGRDSIQEELIRAGWQDPAIILATGLCAWRSGPTPVLEAQFNPDFLEGLMALQWSGEVHDTEALRDKKRDYSLIAEAGYTAYWAAMRRDPVQMARAMRLSCMAQEKEGMKPLSIGRSSTGHYSNEALAAKYCGSGWGGYVLYLFDTPAKRDTFVRENVNAKAIEPYLRSVESSVLLWA